MKRCLQFFAVIFILFPVFVWAAIPSLPTPPSYPNPANTGTTYYVAVTGNNDTGEGTALLPWRTLTYALTQVAAGNTIELGAGTYVTNENEPLEITKVGSATEWTIIKGEAGQTVTLNFNLRIMPSTRYIQLDNLTSTAGTARSLLHIYASTTDAVENIVVSNFTTTNAGTWGINIGVFSSDGSVSYQGVQNLYFRDVEIANKNNHQIWYWPGNSIKQATNWVFERVSNHDSAGGDGYGDAFGGSLINTSGYWSGHEIQGMYFIDCDVYNNTEDGIDLQNTAGTTYIEGCKFYNNSGRSIVFYGGDNWLINSLIYEEKGADQIESKGLDHDPPDGTYVNHYIVNNFIGKNRRNDWYGLIWNKYMTNRNSPGRWYIYNNIFWLDAADGRVLIFSDRNSATQSSIAEIDNNYLFAAAETSAYIIADFSVNNDVANPIQTFDFSELSAWIADTTYGPNNSDANSILRSTAEDGLSDPGFVSAGDDDYHLSSTSLAIDAGEDLSAKGLITGFDDVTRPQGSYFDIGAYEFSHSTVTGGNITLQNVEVH